MNANKLKGKLKEKEATYRQCADYIGISLTSFNNKMNGKSSFKLIEAEKLAMFLSMSVDEKASIFLD